jgi:ribosome biogenesis GTPase
VPDGGFIIDTPGMRELQLWDAAERSGETFEEIEALAAGLSLSPTVVTETSHAVR